MVAGPLFRAISLAFALCSFLTVIGPTPARAFTVVSNGTSYDVEITSLASNVSFNAADAGGALKASPWFGDFAFARDVAAALPDSLLASGTEVFLPYRLSLGGFAVNSIAVSAAGPRIDWWRSRQYSAFDIFDGTLDPQQAWLIGTARSAPEIDGLAFLQLLFILGTLLAVRASRRGPERQKEVCRADRDREMVLGAR